MAKVHYIWSNQNINEEEWKDSYKDYLEVNGYEDEDDAPLTLDEYIDETLNDYIYDERANLHKKVDGVIVCFASLGLWDGKHNGAKIIGEFVSKILYSDCDYNTWYCDRYNVRCVAVHHDGTNNYLYRVCRDKEQAEKLIEKFVCGDYNEKDIMKRTKSLRPYVAKVYGW